MKYLAFIFSFYIISLTVAPAVQLLREKLAYECGKSCSDKSKSDKDSDGCNKRECSTFSCCYKNVFFFSHIKHTIHYFPDLVQTNNFGFNEMVTSYNLFDIWHPPKLV